MNKKEIISKGNTVRFDFEIRQTLEYDNKVFVLFSIPMQCQYIRNVCCFRCGEFAWQIEDLDAKYPMRRNLPMEAIAIINGLLIGTDFYGRRYSIDMSNGKIVSQLPSTK